MLTGLVESTSPDWPKTLFISNLIQLEEVEYNLQDKYRLFRTAALKHNFRVGVRTQKDIIT